MHSLNLKVPRSHRVRTLIFAVLAIVIIVSACELTNNPPVIRIDAEDETPLTGSRQTLFAIAEDLDEDPLRISWSTTGGTLSKFTGDEVQFTAPLDRGPVTVAVVADDRKGLANSIDSASIILEVINDAPTILSFSANANFVLLGNSVELTVSAIDANDEEMEYEFFTSPAGVGTFSESTAPFKSNWTAPTVEKTPFARSFDLVTKVQDERGFFSTDTLSILVYSEYGTVWVADSDSRNPRVSKYSDRGDFILNASHSFVRPVALANNIFVDFGVYVADAGRGEVVKLSAAGSSQLTYTGMPNISDMALHRDSGTLWVLSHGDSSLTVINIFTKIVIKKVYGFFQPDIVTINQSTGDVWIADSGQNIIYQFNAKLAAALPDTVTSLNVTQFGGGQLDTPINISVLDRVSSNAIVYIADKRDSDGQIEQLVSSGNSVYSFGTTISGFDRPTLLASTSDGRVWVANSFGVVSYFTATTNGSDRISTISYEFKNPQTMTADPVTGEVWIGDNGTNEVVKMVIPDSTDVIISGFGFVEDLVISK
ncbi:MAG: hypothetical protein IID15_03410 [Candidatus Marinimicrobia bacterium]|nr:hypothetical protein [Candidatus Neomarinimicrobiota bacterium]